MARGDRFELTRRELMAASALGLTAWATGCGSSSGRSADADLILHNAKVLTVDHANTIAQAVAVKDGILQAVGPDDAILLHRGVTTDVIDLGGRVLTPGLIDSHFHLAYLEVMSQMAAFLPPEVKTLDDFLTKLEELVAETPAGEWIQIYYMVLQDGTQPTLQNLDPVSPENPVWVLHQSGHYGYANQVALDLAEITEATRCPPGGVIEKDEHGNLTGGFYNHRAMNLLREALPPRPEDSAEKSILEGQSMLHAVGITSIQDVYVYGLDSIDVYMRMGRNGAMTVRSAVYPVIENPREVAAALALERYEDPYVRLGGYKLQIDGSALTSYCHEPIDGTHYNLPAWPEDLYKQVVRDLHDSGLQICVHCVGDAAVDLTLDAFESAMNANPRPDPRHRIEHCLLTTPEATLRIRDLGVVVSNTPTFMITAGDAFVRLYGEARANRIIVAREWIEAGVTMALGSDYPTVPWYNPQRTIAEAMARMTVSENVINPAQSLTFTEALRAHTMGSAYAGFDEDVKGSIEPGKMADLAVWTEDPTSVEAVDLPFVTVDMTFVGGELLYHV